MLDLKTTSHKMNKIQIILTIGDICTVIVAFGSLLIALLPPLWFFLAFYLDKNCTPQPEEDEDNH